MLSSSFYDNIVRLSNIISRLTAHRINRVSVQVIQDEVDTFVVEYSQLYPDWLHRYNVHSLLHLPSVVEEFGPLTCSSGFLVENFMGVMSRKVKTSTKVAEQVINKMTVAATLEAIKCGNKFGLAKEIVAMASIFGNKDQPNVRLSTPNNRPLTKAEERALKKVSSDKLVLFSKLAKENIVIVPLGSKTTRTSNSLVQNKNKAVYRVSRIASGRSVFLVGAKYTVTATELINVGRLVPANAIEAFPFEDVETILGEVVFDQTVYCLFPENIHL